MENSAIRTGGIASGAFKEPDSAGNKPTQSNNEQTKMNHIIKPNFLPSTTIVLLCLGASTQSHAADCESNFSTSGNFLTGKIFQTIAELPDVAPDNAFQGAYQFVAKEGWKIQQANKTARTISALNSNAAKSGKAVPLNVTVEPSHSGAKVAIVYSTPAGITSPEDAVKDQFCKIVAAAMSPQSTEPTTESRKTPTTANNDATAQLIGEPKPDTGNLIAAASTDGSHLCLAKACLGMTVEQASTLNLEAAGTFKFSFSKGLGNTYGLDTSGQRVWFTTGGDFDKKTAAQFAQKVHTVCVADFATAKMKASDGQPIRLVFRPTIRNGRGMLVLTQIDRQLPGSMSASELKSFEDQARERYGDAFGPSTSVGVRKPTAMLHYDAAMGRSLRLVLPFENIHGKLLEQPECSDKPRLD